MNNKHPVIQRVYLYILILTVLLFLVVWSILKSSRTSPQQTTVESPTAQGQVQKVVVKKVQKGSVSLATKDDATRVAVGVPLTLYLVATSENEDIVGYDALLKYDKDAFSLVSVSSLLPEFEIFKTDGPDHLTVTATQPPKQNTRTLLDNTKILQYVFTPKEKGNYTFTLLGAAGRETTKFVNTQTALVVPKTAPVSVEVY